MPGPENNQCSSARDRRPWHITLRGWLALLDRVRQHVLRDHVFLISAGVAFLAILALFPTVSALLSLYGLFTTPADLHQQIQTLSSVAPPALIHLLNSNLHGITRQSGSTLSLTVAISTVIAIWVAARAVMGIIGALNIVHDEQERRSWLRLATTAVALAIGAIIFWVGALVLIVGTPFLLSQLHIDSSLLRLGIQILRWLLIACTTLVSMATLYFFGPCHPQPRWHWLSVGSAVATLLWLCGSAGLSFYTSHMGAFSNAYGRLGAIVVLQLWFFLTAFVFLIGAEINIEVERQMRAPGNDPTRSQA